METLKKLIFHVTQYQYQLFNIDFVGSFGLVPVLHVFLIARGVKVFRQHSTIMTNG